MLVVTRNDRGEVRDLTRRFGGLTAVNRVSLSVQAGEVRSIIGVSPRTSTDSDSVATLRVTGMSRVWPTFSTIPLLSTLLKPCSSAVMS